MILISKYLIPKGYTGLAIFPFVFLKHKQLKGNIILLNHEKIHLRQQVELLVLPFYFLYVMEFFVRYIQYKNLHEAYKNISFEREAYYNEMNLEYLKQRRFWQFLGYYKKDEI